MSSGAGPIRHKSFITKHLHRVSILDIQKYTLLSLERLNKCPTLIERDMSSDYLTTIPYLISVARTIRGIPVDHFVFVVVHVCIIPYRLWVVNQYLIRLFATLNRINPETLRLAKRLSVTFFPSRRMV